MLDITAPKMVEVGLRADQDVLWVNVDGACVLRVCRIPKGQLFLSKSEAAPSLHTIPDFILVDAAFFERSEFAVEFAIVSGRVVSIIRDSLGDQYCIFELPDIVGLHTIHLGSNFFRGWDHNNQ